MHLEASDPTFIDVLITSNAGRNDRLDRIDRLIDWPKDRIMHRGRQASVGALALAAEEERAAVEGSGACGAGARDDEALLWYWRVRCMGLMRNEAEALFKALGCNLRRADGLREGCAAHG